MVNLLGNETVNLGRGNGGYGVGTELGTKLFSRQCRYPFRVDGL